MPEVILHTTLLSTNGDDKRSVLEKLSKWASSQGWKIEEEKSGSPLPRNKKQHHSQQTNTVDELQAVIDASLTGISLYKAIRDESNTIVDFEWIRHNKVLKQYTGGRNLVGKRCLEEYPGIKETGIFDRYVKAIEESESQDFEIYYKYDGFDIWCRITAVKFDDGIIASTEDITARKKAEQEILLLKEEIAQKATDKYYSLFNSVDEGYCLIQMLYDPEGQPVDWIYLEANPTFERQSGFNPLGKKVSEAVGAVEAFWFQFYNDVLQTRQPARTEHYVAVIDRWYSIYASPVGETGDLLAVVFDDITERKQTEARQAFLLQLSDALRSLGDSVAIVETATREAMNYFHADRCYYCEIEGDKAVIRRDTFRGDLPSVSGTYPLSNFPILRAAIEAKQPFIVEDVRTTHFVDEAFRQLCLQLQIVSFIDVPVIKYGKSYGVLCLVQSSARKWTSIEMELVVETAERTWAAVERAKAEEGLRMNEERMRGQKEAFQAAVNGAALDHSLNILTRMVVEETKGAARTAFYIVNAEGVGLYTLRGAGNMPEAYADETDGFLTGEDSFVCGLAVPAGAPVLTTDVFEEPRWEPWTPIAVKYDYRGCWSFPIKTLENKAIGTFAMYFHTAREATLVDLGLADVVTQTAAVIISNYIIAQEKALAEKAWMQSEEMFRVFITASSAQVYKMNADWSQLYYLNGKSFLADTEQSGSSWLEKYIPLEEQPKVSAAIQEAIRTKSLFELEHPVIQTDGTVGWIHLKALPILNGQGEITEWLGAASDITERKQAEQQLREFNVSLEQQVAERTCELRESKELLQATQDSSLDMIQVFQAVRDSNGKIIDFVWILNNHRAEQVYGDVIGKRLLEYNPGVVEAGIFDTFVQVVETGVTQQQERHYVHEQFDGWFYQSAVKLGDGVATTTTEITARKQAELQIKEQAHFIEQVVNNVPDTVLIFDLPQQRNIFANPEVEVLVGYTPAELQAYGPGIIQHLIYPEDWNLQAGLLAALTTLEDGATQEAEYRLQHKDGSIRWVQARRAVFKRNKTGAAEQVIAILHDITLLKNAEQELKEEHYFLEQIANKTPHLIYVFDLEEQRFTYINKRVNELIGQTEEYVYAMGPHLFQAIIHPEDLPKRTAYMNEMTTLREGEVREIEFRIWVGNGFRYFCTKDSIFKTENGVVKQVIGIGEDITLEKMLQEQAQKGKGHIGLN